MKTHADNFDRQEPKSLSKANVKRFDLSRRNFIGKAGAAVAAFTIVPRYVLGGEGYTPPSEKLNIAAIGAGGMGKSNINAVADDENIVALCDVDDQRAAEMYQRFPAVKKYARAVILIGQDAPKLKAALTGASKILFAKSMQEAVKFAAQEAQSGDIVLLSPACASFDMFNNFEHRGEMFIKSVIF